MKKLPVFSSCLVALTLLVSCGGKSTGTGGWSEAIAVAVTVMADGQSATDRNYVGTVESEKEIDLCFPLGGTLTNVAVSNGQSVKKGQMLAQIDATAATSLHAAAEATLRQAEDAYRRMQAVYKEGGISEVRWVQMETDLEKARQTELSSRKHLDDCTLRAPFSGVVSCSDRTVGQEMRPAETFAKLLDMTRLRIAFSVPEQEVSLLAVGDIATAEIPSIGGKILQLRICDKSLVANKLGHTYKIYATITGNDSQGLLPDMVAKVHTNLRPIEGMIVPTTSIQTMPEGNVVWVVRNGTAHRQRVTVGDFVHSGVIITEGLAAGDTVVTKGMQKLYTGAKVKIEN